MEEIKVGEYVRTKKGNLGKVIDISNVTGQQRKKYLIKWDISKAYYITSVTITKHSPNLIDLIKVGDYVNGYKVVNKNDDLKELVLREDLGLLYINEGNNLNKIKSIATHEQFAQIEYKVEE